MHKLFATLAAAFLLSGMCYGQHVEAVLDLPNTFSSPQTMPLCSYPVASLPTNLVEGTICIATDANPDCSNGLGAGSAVCRWTGGAWSTVAGGGAGSGATLPPYTQSFTNQTTLTIPGSVHGYRTKSLIMACYDNASPAHQIEPAQLSIDTLTYDVTVLFASPQSGACVVNGGGGTGPQGSSIAWLGTFAAAPFSAALNNAYYDSTQKASFIWNGTVWSKMMQDGSTGTGVVGSSGISTLDGASQSSQTFVSGPHISVKTDSSLGTHTFSVAGLADVAVSGNWSDLKNLPTVFPPALPTTATPGGVFIPVSCPLVTDPLTGAAVPQHVYGIQTSNGQLLCSPDNNWDLQLQVNGVTVAAGVRAINFVGSSGMNISAANNSATGVITYTVTGSTATQTQSVSFTPLPGAYAGAQNVVLGCPSPTPTIYYTTDGSTPTHGSSVYASPVSVSAGTIEAICASSGLADSNLSSAVYSQTFPVASLATTTASFDSQLVGSPSSAVSIGLSNIGTAPLIVASLALSGTNAADFSQTNNCTTLAVNTSCTVNVIFTPGVSGARSATLNITDNASGSPHTVSLSGTGAYPAGSAAPSSISFVATNVGITGSSQLVTLSNSGAVAMTIASVGLSGTNSADFSILANNCLTVAPSGSCSVSLSFTPSAGGARSALLTFTDNASNTPQTVGLSGSGLASGASVSPSNLTFTSQQTSTSSTAQTVTVQNTGTSPLGFSSIGVTGANSGDFAQSNNCVSLTPSSTCTVNVTFTPQATGSRSASLSLNDNAATSPQLVSLAGTGVVPLTIPAQTIPNVLLNTAYSYQMVASGGVAPYTWVITGDELWAYWRRLMSYHNTDIGPQTIPYLVVPTVAMSSTGLISGLATVPNPPDQDSTTNVVILTLQVTDSTGSRASQIFTVVIP